MLHHYDPKPPLYGLYKADTMVRNQDTLPPLLTDGRRWQHIAIEFPGRAVIQTMPGHLRWFDLEVDTSTQRAVFIQGRFSDTVSVQAAKWDKEQFLLMERGFNGVNESPFNR